MSSSSSCSSTSARASESGGRGGVPWALPDRAPRVTELGPVGSEADVLLDAAPTPPAVSSALLHRALLPDDAACAWDTAPLLDGAEGGKMNKDDVCPTLPPPLDAPVSSGELLPRPFFRRALTPARMEREDGALTSRRGGGRSTAALPPPVDARVGGAKRAEPQRSALNRKLLRGALVTKALPKPQEAAGTDDYDPYRNDSVAPRPRAALLLPPVDAAEDGVFVKKRATQAARALSPPLDSTVEAECSKKIVAEEGGVGVNKPELSGIVGKNNTKLREALLDQALRALPPPLDSRIRVEGGDYDPYALDLFLYRRAVPPWDAVWESRPLVLHDRRLVEALDALVMWPWYLSDEPRDQVEAVTRVLGHHPGPVSSFRLHSSLCPDTEVLERWMDALSDKGVAELVVFNLYHDVTATRFPLQRLNTDSLTILALGFFRIGAEELSDRSWCDGVSSLVTLSLTGCTFPVSALSAAVSKLGCLRTLTVASCDLALAGRDAIGRHEDQGSLIIDSMSLHHLRLWKCAGTKLTIEYAPLLKYLETGITPYVTGAATAGTHNVHKVSIVVREAAALRELHAVALRLHALEIHGAKGPAFKWKKRESLHKLTILGIALNFCLPEQAASLVELLSQFPALTELRVSRVDDLPASGDDDLSVSESWYLGLVPKCLRSSLQKLFMSDYREGTGELALLTSLLETTANLVSLTVYPHASMVSPEKAIATRIRSLPRASKQCHVSVVSADSPAM